VPALLPGRPQLHLQDAELCLRDTRCPAQPQPLAPGQPLTDPVAFAPGQPNTRPVSCSRGECHPVCVQEPSACHAEQQRRAWHTSDVACLIDRRDLTVAAAAVAAATRPPPVRTTQRGLSATARAGGPKASVMVARAAPARAPATFRCRATRTWPQT
jgi:hypothetical protein